MLGLKLIGLAIGMLTSNIRAAVQITVLPLMIGYGLAFTIVYLLFGGEFFEVMSGLKPIEDTNRLLPGFLILSILVLPTFCWSAVAWHRFVLLHERPKILLPAFRSSDIASYFWAGGRIALVGLVALTSILLALFLFGAAVFSIPVAAVPVLEFVVVAVLNFLGSVAFFRIALILPAVAINRPMTLKQSWVATRGHVTAFVVVTVFLFTLNWIISLFAEIESVNWVLYIVFTWFTYAFNVSLLTMLYATCEDKQPL